MVMLVMGRKADHYRWNRASELQGYGTRQQRVIRIFVSSTFRDMKEEREELVKRVFPKLRKMCEKRGVTWGEVDLRWGITDEQKAEGKVLPICLKEIHESRPYFIGMLGDKYGWIPLEISEELIEQEPWLEEHREKSVTELEIIHGVLNNPEMADHAYFYFRDPHYVNTQPAEMRDDLIEGPTPEEIKELGGESAQKRADERREKLITLKNRVRASGLPVRENYENPQQLGEHVFQDFTKLINELFPEGEKLDPLDRETVEHDAFAQSRFSVYIGRDEYFDRLDEYIKSDSQPLVVLGESGSGKSALLANWVATYREEHPDELVITHFIGATPYSADWAAMLRRIMGEFKRRFDIQQDIPAEPDKLRSAFANWLHMASAAAEKKSEKIILILDALNQLEDRDQAPDLVWLPPFIPENIRLILSTLPGRPLDDLKKREWPKMIVEPLDDSERMQLIQDYLAQYRKTLSDPRVEKIASAEQTDNPLYLRALLDELRLFGVHQHLDRAIEHYLSSESIPELYEKMLKRLEQDYEREWPGLVQDAMTNIWASRRGLSEVELLDLLGAGGKPLPRAQWVHFHNAVERMLVNRGGLLGFAHDYIREAIHDRFLPDEKKQKTARMNLADYFAGQEVNPRKVDELPWQLVEAESWQQLHDLLADLEFFSAAWEENQFEVKVYWTKVENSTDLDLVDAYRPVLDAPDEVSDSETTMHVSNLLNDTGHLSEALLLMDFLTEFYRKAGEDRKLTASLRRQGNILLDHGDLDGAMKLYTESECICRELGDKSGMAGSLNNQGLILWRRSDSDGAMKLYKETERIWRELGDRSALSTSLGNQGIILNKWGDSDGAMKLYKEQEKICRELGFKEGLMECLNNQGDVLIDRGEIDKAMDLLKEAEGICHELGYKYGLSACLVNQGSAFIILKELDKALNFLKDAECISRELGDKYMLSYCFNNQGDIYKKIGEFDKALNTLKEAASLSRELGDKYLLSHCLNNQGDIYKIIGKPDEAMNTLKEAESIAREIGFPDVLAICLADQAEVLLGKGETENALPLAEEAYEIATKHNFSKHIKKSKAVLDKIRAELG